MHGAIARIVVLTSVVVVAHATAAGAQCLTKPAKPQTSWNGNDAYAAAKAEANKWNPDSVLTKMTTTSEGPLDAEGRSADWAIQFFSPGAQKLNMMTFAKTGMTCNVIDRTGGGRPILVTDKTIFDTKRLLQIAHDAGGARLDQKTVNVSAELVQNPRAGTIWHIDYNAIDGGRTVLKVVIDSTSGVVTFKDPK